MHQSDHDSDSCVIVKGKIIYDVPLSEKKPGQLQIHMNWHLKHKIHKNPAKRKFLIGT